MSHGSALPARLLGFGVPASVGAEMPTLQMNADPSGTLPLLDSSMFLPYFDGTMSMMGLDPAVPLPPQSHAVAPAPPSSSTATVGSAAQSPFSPDESASGIPGAGNPPREGLGSGNLNSPSMQTEFTKRRNWPTKVIEELQDLLHILDANGRIKHVSPSAERLAGYKPSELRGLLMRDLLHPDDVGLFSSEMTESMASGSPLRIFCRLRKKNGKYAVFEAVGHAHIAAAKFSPNPHDQAPFCQAVFLMARPYPTKSAALLDSFLEHKMENERLKRRIAELQKEEQEEAEESERTWQQQQRRQQQQQRIQEAMAGRLGAAPPQQPVASAFVSSPPQERRPSVDSGATESLPGTRHPSIGGTHADTIEMLTGLRYQEGERSRGITTGNPSPALITGDVGIAIPVDRDQRTGEKKKKLKVAEEYVCTDCGTLESPEWRKGPSGPKTLCNACGLRWAKKEKKKSTSSGAGGVENRPPGVDPAN